MNTQTSRLSVFLFLLLAIMILFSGCSTLNTQYKNANGVELYSSGQYAQAIEVFQSNINANPEDADAYYNIGAIYHQLGRVNRDTNQYAQAEQYYRAALGKNPNHSPAYRGLSVWYMEQNRQDDAFTLLKNWNTLSPDLSDPKIELARLYQETGQNRDAIDCLSATLALDPRNARALRALGYLREAGQEYDQALVNYRNSLQYNPAQPDLTARVASLESQLVK